jgi:hypothetical protein
MTSGSVLSISFGIVVSLVAFVAIGCGSSKPDASSGGAGTGPDGGSSQAGASGEIGSAGRAAVAVLGRTDRGVRAGRGWGGWRERPGVSCRGAARGCGVQRSGCLQLLGLRGSRAVDRDLRRREVQRYDWAMSDRAVRHDRVPPDSIVLQAQ